MDDGILTDILQLEQEIKATLEAERQRAERWLATACRAIDAELVCTRADEERSAERQQAEAVAAGRRAAARQLRAARRGAAALVALPDATLRPLLHEALHTILAGGDDDRPDDKS